MKGLRGKIISIILTIALATGVFSVNGITAKAEAVSYYLYMGNNEVTSENDAYNVRGVYDCSSILVNNFKSYSITNRIIMVQIGIYSIDIIYISNIPSTKFRN